MTDKPRKLKALPSPPAAEFPAVPAAVIGAVKALNAGTALPHQQQLALDWIVREAGGKAYFPYQANERDTCLALGRLFVADCILGCLNADLSSLRRDHVPAETSSTVPRP